MFPAILTVVALLVATIVYYVIDLMKKRQALDGLVSSWTNPIIVVQTCSAMLPVLVLMFLSAATAYEKQVDGASGPCSRANGGLS